MGVIAAQLRKAAYSRFSGHKVGVVRIRNALHFCIQASDLRTISFNIDVPRRQVQFQSTFSSKSCLNYFIFLEDNLEFMKKSRILSFQPSNIFLKFLT